MNDWLTRLAVNVLKMDVILTARSAYCGQEGNEGLTGQIGLVTSHATIHSWDELGYHMVDIYSCRDFSDDDVLEYFRSTLKPTSCRWMRTDREEFNIPEKQYRTF